MLVIYLEGEVCFVGKDPQPTIMPPALLAPLFRCPQPTPLPSFPSVNLRLTQPYRR